MICYTVHEAVVSGLEHLYIVTNKRKPSLQRYLESDKLETDLQREGRGNRVSIPRITFIDQPAPLGSGDAIYRTKEMIGQEPFYEILPTQRFKFLGTFKSVGICCCIVEGNAGLRKVISQKKFHPNSAVV